MPDYLPERDVDFSLWVGRLADYVAAHAAELPVSPAERAALSAAAGALAGLLAEQVAARDAAAAARAAKDAGRAVAEAIARVVVRKLQADPAFGDDQRALVGITVRGRGSQALPAPASRPFAVVETTDRGRHVLRVVDEHERGRLRRRRPGGTLGAEVWVRVAGDVGREPAPMQFIGLATDGAFTAEFDAGQGGKQAQYQLRWLGTRGRPGPWGPPTTATIAA